MPRPISTMFAGAEERRMRLSRIIPKAKGPGSSREKNYEEMYPFTHLGFNVHDIQNRFEGIKGPLTLFAPFHHEDYNNEEEEANKDDTEEKQNIVELKRPITPINDEIKESPQAFNKLVKLVRRRISAKSEGQYLDKEDQLALGAIIMSEVSEIWSTFKLKVADPFLSQDENNELHRRITVHIVTACEHLFKHYIAKAEVLNKRGIFSRPANMSRLKAQLMLDANKFLNILTIRRYIAEDMRKQIREKPSILKSPRLTASNSKGDVTKRGEYLSHSQLVQASRPRESPVSVELVISEELKDLNYKMPKLDTEKLLHAIQELPKRPSLSQGSRESRSSFSRAATTTKKTKAAKTDTPLTDDDLSRLKILQKSFRATSMTALVHDNEFEGLGKLGGVSTYSQTLDDLRKDHSETMQANRLTQGLMEDKSLLVMPGTREYVAEDLKWLVQQRCLDNDTDDVNDLPPLLQAVTRNAKHDGQGEILRRQLVKLNKRQNEQRLGDILKIEGPKHPQPTTVVAKMPNNGMARASDIRVSERNCLSSITLQKYATVYNDLIDEIDQKTVKALDSKLFLGGEITEVYREIMKTVPTNHLLIEDDRVVEPCAESGAHLVVALASSTLKASPDKRIINSKLHHKITAPWGAETKVEWAKNAQPPTINPKLMSVDRLGDTFVKEDAKSSKSGQTKSEIPDYMAQQYASWYEWWKNTMNSDDYMKYLSTQKTDYMGVIFHFYDSDDEDDDVHTAIDSHHLPVKQSAEMIQAINELREQKNQYTEGMWNCNSVMLGGLGNDPFIDEIELKSVSTGTVSARAVSSKPFTSRTTCVSRKHVQDMQQQRLSKMTYSADDQKGSAVRKLSIGTIITQTEASKVKEVVHQVIVPVSIQERLEKLWSKLYMPETMRLDMAIKYSSESFHSNINHAVTMWEVATNLIIKREEFIAQLENFERLASDPNRFFEKGHRGSSVARLEEAKIRNSLYKKIKMVEVELKIMLDNVQKELVDEITFQGRPYVEKMKWDRTEMLFWLQEERKQQAMNLEQRFHNSSVALSNVHLEPLSANM